MIDTPAGVLKITVNETVVPVPGQAGYPSMIDFAGRQGPIGCQLRSRLAEDGRHHLFSEGPSLADRSTINLNCCPKSTLQTRSEATDSGVFLGGHCAAFSDGQELDQGLTKITEESRITFWRRQFQSIQPQQDRLQIGQRSWDLPPL